MRVEGLKSGMEEGSPIGWRVVSPRPGERREPLILLRGRIFARGHDHEPSNGEVVLMK